MFAFLVVAMVISEQFYKRPLNETVFFGLLTAISGLFGMNLAAQIKSIGAKKQVARDIVNSDTVTPASSQDAKEVLQSEKP